AARVRRSRPLPDRRVHEGSRRRPTEAAPVVVGRRRTFQEATAAAITSPMPKRTKHYLSAALLLACMGCQPCAEYIKADKEWLDVMEPHLRAGIALEPDAETRQLL